MRRSKCTTIEIYFNCVSGLKNKYDNPIQMELKDLDKVDALTENERVIRNLKSNINIQHRAKAIGGAQELKESGRLKNKDVDKIIHRKGTKLIIKNIDDTKK